MEPHLPPINIEARLIVAGQEDDASRSRAVRRAVTLIGSSEECAIRITSSKVSSFHCAIINTGRALFLRDLASRTGTSVNDWDTVACRLEDGDRIQIRGLELVVRIDRPAACESEADSGVHGVDRPLVLNKGSDSEAYRAERPVVLIGRHERCDLVLDDPKVSRVHALLFQADRRWAVADLHSANGVRVNDRPLDGPAVLGEGDRLKLGHDTYCVAFADPPDPVPNPEEESKVSELRDAAALLEAREQELEQRAADLQKFAEALAEQRISLERQDREAEDRLSSAAELEQDQLAASREVQERLLEVKQRALALEKEERRVAHLAADLDSRQQQLREHLGDVAGREQVLAQEVQAFDEREWALAERERVLAQRERDAERADEQLGDRKSVV